MRLLVALIGLAALQGADTIRVDVVRNEVWITRNAESNSGQSKQLTNDGKAKVQAELSGRRDRIAYYEQCPESEHCTPTVVILDLDGKRLLTFQPRLSRLGSGEPCASILRIVWLRGGDAIGIECHATPSASEYVEIELKSGKTVRDLVGFGFVSSPDGRLVAHVGPLIHFAPPFAKSELLFLDDTAVYPLPKGTKPVVVKPVDERPNAVQDQGDRYTGIHEFGPQLAWSPDSKTVGLVDCTFDWVQTGDDRDSGRSAGEERDRRCSLAAVSVTGEFKLLPLRDVPAKWMYESGVSWLDNHRVQVTFPASSGKAPAPRVLTVR